MNGETRRTEKYKKRCSQMPKKTTITRHHVSPRLAKAKKSSTREKCWQGCETTALPEAVRTNGKNNHRRTQLGISNKVESKHLLHLSNLISR